MFCPFFFFFNDTATTEIYTLSLHDALPISFAQSMAQALAPHGISVTCVAPGFVQTEMAREILDGPGGDAVDRKSTRLNSSHANISYAVFCLKKKKKT